MFRRDSWAFYVLRFILSFAVLVRHAMGARPLTPLSALSGPARFSRRPPF